MLIHIMYPGNKFDYVREFMLNNLIVTGQIEKFRRSSGWVSIDDDLVRQVTQDKHYYGVEKRSLARVFSSPKSGLFQTEPIGKNKTDSRSVRKHSL